MVHLSTTRDHWEDHGLDYTDLSQQSNVSAFQHTVLVCHSLSAKERSSSDFMPSVTICSDFRAQEEEICHYFYLFLFCLPWSNGARLNVMALTEAEDIKKRWQEYTELYRKDLNDSNNHNGVITHLKPDILEWEVKWALGSITANKVSGGDGIPVELFKSWKMVLLKCCTWYVSKFGKLSSGHRTGKG